MISYFLQVVFFQLLFLLVYEVLLKRETFFTWNRWYLLITALISLILPFLKIEGLALLVPQESLAGMTNVWLPEVFIGEQQQNIKNVTAISVSDESTKISWWLVVYGIGLCGSSFLLIRKYQHLNRLFKYRITSAEKNLRIIEVPESSIACTFYRTIFLGNNLTEAEKLQILSHELVHVKQKHSLDLLFFEVLKVFFWFNPLVYIYQNRMAAVHEFIADASVVKSTPKKSYYEQLLNSAFNTTNISFINQFFNHSLIKKRIVMLQKSRSKATAKLKYLVMIPLILAMLTYVACSDDKLSSSDVDFKKYNYTLRAGDEESAKDSAKNYLNFLEENPEFVGWRIVDHKNETIEYSIHPKDEEVLEDYKKYKYLSPSGEERFHYIKELNPYANTTTNKQEANNFMKNEGSVPFAIIEEVPVFPGCEGLATNEQRKECMSHKIQEHVQKEFNTGLGKELGLTGLNRVIAIFKINSQGQVIDVRSRAPHPDLEEEAKRVINSLPIMTPGKHKGQEVYVTYSLPIVFQIGE